MNCISQLEVKYDTLKLGKTYEYKTKTSYSEKCIAQEITCGTYGLSLKKVVYVGFMLLFFILHQNLY